MVSDEAFEFIQQVENEMGAPQVAAEASGGVEFVRVNADAEQLGIIRDDLEIGVTAGISVDDFAVGEIPEALRDAGNPNAVLLVDGGTDADGNEVPSSLLLDPSALLRQAPFRIALEENFPDDAETRNLLQRQFDQIRNDNLRPLDDGEEIGDVTAIFDGLDLEEIGEVNVVDVEDDDNVDIDVGDEVDVDVVDEVEDDDDVDAEVIDDIDDEDEGDDAEVEEVAAAGDGVVLEGTQAADVLVGTDGVDVINGLAGQDTITGFGGDDVLDAGGGEDIVRAGDGDDRIIGGGGQDELFGDAGNDVITGGIGDDQLFGGDGDDVLNGELVNDIITTGAGADTVIFEESGGNDRITDFEAGVDSLSINGFGANPQFEAVQRGADTVLRIENNDRIVLENFDVDDFSEDDVTFDADQSVA